MGDGDLSLDGIQVRIEVFPKLCPRGPSGGILQARQVVQLDHRAQDKLPPVAVNEDFGRVLRLKLPEIRASWPAALTPPLIARFHTEIGAMSHPNGASDDQYHRLPPKHITGDDSDLICTTTGAL